MGDLVNQMDLMRKEKHLAYLKYMADIEAIENNKLQKIKDEEINNKIVDVMGRLSNKYKHIFNGDKKEKATYIIQKFVRHQYFLPECINNDEIQNIPPLYRFRINITNNHLNEYSEENISNDMLPTHRFIYKMTLPVISKMPSDILFRYCFDIRKLYTMRHQIIVLYDNFYFMQPDDHVRIIKCWNKVNGETHQSIIYLNNFEYYKSLSIDEYRTLDGTNNNNETRIKKILEESNNNDNQIKSDEFDNDLISNIIKKYTCDEV